MKRREVIKLIGSAAAAWPLGARAQLATKIPQVGVLSLGRGDKSDASLATLDAFMPALHELGYTEGQNIAFDRKFADGDANKLSRLAQELVDSRVDAIVVLATPPARAVKQATSSIPIIAIGMGDPVEDELVSSLARPGGNVTGPRFLAQSWCPDACNCSKRLFRVFLASLCCGTPVPTASAQRPPC